MALSQYIIIIRYTKDELNFHCCNHPTRIYIIHFMPNRQFKKYYKKYFFMCKIQKLYLFICLHFTFINDHTLYSI